MAERLRVTVYDGKYTVIQAEEGGMTFLRHGEPWEAADRDFQHVGLILALAQEVQSLRDEIARLNASLERVQENFAQSLKASVERGYQARRTGRIETPL